MSDVKMEVKDTNTVDQPESYSKAEIEKLKEFIETVKGDTSRSALACWGNHSNYNKGY